MKNSLSAKPFLKLLPFAAAIFVMLLSAACGSGNTNPSTSATPNVSTGTTSGTTGATATGGTSTGSGSGTGTGTTGASGNGSGGSGTVAPTTSAGLPTPPASAIVFSHTEDSVGNWGDCSDCAGGTVTTDYWSAANQTTPSLDGSSRELYVGGPAWADVLWYERFGPYNQAANYPYNFATNFLWDFYVYFDSASAANVWSAEYDAFQAISGQEFMMGSECVFGDNIWQVWDSLHAQWVTIPGVPCPRFSPNTWHHIAWYTTRPSANQYTFNTLVVDDKSYPINMTFNSNPINWGDVIGVQWQLDVDGQGNPLHEWVDNSTLTVW